MAQKEATVYIVDVGLTMGEQSHGRTETNLDWALTYVWDKITSAVATGRKTLYNGVVALRSYETNNDLDSEEEYHHINVLQDLGQTQMADLRKLQRGLVVSNNIAGDAASALVVAIQMIATTCKKLQYIRKIVLVTDARAPMHTGDLAHIVDKLKEDRIQLVVLGVDFDDAEFGFKEESKDSIKAENEEALRQLCTDCDGDFATLAQATDELGMPNVKQTKPIPSYKGMLTLGNPEEYETAISINIERYPKVMVAKPPSASKFVVRNDLEATQAATEEDGEQAGADGLASVKNARTYQVVDEEAPGGKRDVEFDELAKGYEYGRTAVHISESDQNVTTYETQQSYDILGFIDANQYDRYMDMNRSCIIIAERTNEKAYMALSSLIHALYELETYAVARVVNKENKQPLVVLLAPNIEPEFECLYEIELPFAEDIRSYRFPPLDRVVTVSGKEISKHRNLPDNDLQNAMNAYVDSMDLSSFGKDDDGEPVEYAALDDTYSPILHRVNQVSKHRAIYTDSEIPPPYEILTRYSQPPQELVDQSQRTLDKLIKSANVKKVPPKLRGKRFGSKRQEVQPESGLDINALLNLRRQMGRIDPQNAVPEFRQMIDSAGSPDKWAEICQQLGKIISDLIKHSVGDSGYQRAIECIRVMREQMSDLEEPAPFNDFLKDLQRKLLAGELGGDRKEMWYRIRRDKVGLITKKECEQGGVEDDEASAFLAAR